MTIKEIFEGIEFRLQSLQENEELFDTPGFQINRQYYQERFEELESLYFWIKKGVENGNQ